MKRFVRLGWLFSVLVVVIGGGYLLSFARLWGASGEWPKPYWTGQTAGEALDKVRQEIHVGMSAEEAKAAARAVGAKLYAVGFICEPGEACDEAAARKNYTLSIEVAQLTSVGPATLVLTVEVRNGIVTRIASPSDSGQ